MLIPWKFLKRSSCPVLASVSISHWAALTPNDREFALHTPARSWSRPIERTGFAGRFLDTAPVSFFPANANLEATAEPDAGLVLGEIYGIPHYSELAQRCLPCPLPSESSTWQ